jgi:F0F1-type ATP synthase membrane subunit c/vacuolar-type H+-ATPase subunit K
MENVTIDEMKKALSVNAVRVFQIIYIAILLGVTVFLGIILYMYSAGSPFAAPAEDTVQQMNIFSLIHAGMFIAGLFISRFLYDLTLKPARAESVMTDRRVEGLSGAEKHLAVMRTAMIIRLALLEGPVLFGLVALFMAAVNGVLYHKGIYWANLASYIYLVYFILTDFPTPEKLLEVFKKRLSHGSA